MPELVITEDRDQVRHLILNRPDKRNAFNHDLVVALGEALRATAAETGVHCVVLRGAGKVFSSGVDIGGLMAQGIDGLRPFRTDWINTCAAAEEMTKPVICAIHGACIGGALETALACDLRVATTDSKLGLPETRLGLIPDVGGSSRLPAVVGLGRAKELIMTSRMIDGEEAHRIGLVNRVCHPDDLDATVDQLVGELLLCSPRAVGLAKRVMDASARPALSVTLEQEVTAQELCVRSEDFGEAAQSYMQKRAPAYSGK